MEKGSGAGDRLTGKDQEQFDNLPPDLVGAIVHGTDDEALQAVNDIRARERLQGITLLGPGALDLLNDMREMNQMEVNKEGSSAVGSSFVGRIKKRIGSFLGRLET